MQVTQGNRITPALYCALEISGVIENDGCCERENQTPQFFSVYARAELAKGGLLECLDDFPGYEAAKDYADKLSNKHGWPIRDYYQLEHRKAGLFHIEAVNIKTNCRLRVTAYPMSEKECQVIVGKMTTYSWRRIELVPVCRNEG